VSDADIINSLDFGRSESILNNTSENPMTDLLLRLTNELIEDWRKELIKNDAYVTGNLAGELKPSSIKPESIETSAPYYWKYVNYGVNGIARNNGAPTHGSAPRGNLTFYQAIKKWMYDKGIKPPEGYTIEQYAGMVKNSIRMKGIKGNHFFDKVLTEQRVDEMSQRVSDLAKEAITIIIKKPK
jgi:hypothetical protein